MSPLNSLPESKVIVTGNFNILRLYIFSKARTTTSEFLVVITGSASTLRLMHSSFCYHEVEKTD